MSLTRPKFSQINSVATVLNDPIVVLNSGTPTPDSDVGFVINRANGAVANVALFWSETTGSFALAYTSDSGVTNANVTVTDWAPMTLGSMVVQGNVAVADTLTLNGGLSVGGSTGSSGQLLSSDGTGGIAWTNASGFDGGTITQALTVTTGIQDTVIGNTVPATATFTQIEITQLVKHNATEVSNFGTGDVTIDNFSSTDYQTAKYVISAVDHVNAHHQSSELIVSHDGANVSIASYAVAYTSTGPILQISANVISGNVQIYANSVSSDNTVKIYRTLISA